MAYPCEPISPRARPGARDSGYTRDRLAEAYDNRHGDAHAAANDEPCSNRRGIPGEHANGHTQSGAATGTSFSNGIAGPSTNKDASTRFGYCSAPCSGRGGRRRRADSAATAWLACRDP